MDFDLRLKALTRLAQSDTEAAAAALRKEFDHAARSLSSETQYDKLEQDLAVLEVIGYRFSGENVKLLLKFVREIESRQITYSEQARLFAKDIAEYRNASTLMVRALEILNQFRYSETRTLLPELINLSRHASESVQKKAFESLKAVSRYNLKLFYDDGERRGIGAIPQKEILDELEALTDENLKRAFPAVLTLLEGVLSPTMEGTTWSYQSVTISRGATPALPSVAELRTRAINLLKRLYRFADVVQERVKVLAALSDATRKHNIGETGSDVAAMVAGNTVEVLDFFRGLVQTEDFQIVQKIESNTYWMYYHTGRDDVRLAALRVEEAIGQHKEYQIYKVLVGFEGIFGKWEEVRKTDGYREETEKARRDEASAFVAAIDVNSYDTWRQRIIAFAKTESDDLATFPVFYHFLESFALAKPKLALKLVLEDVERIERFLIPLLRGLWVGSERTAIKNRIEAWAEEGRYLRQSTKQFLSNTDLDRQLLALLLKKAAETKDLFTVALVMSVAVSNFSDEKTFLVEDFFLPALEILTERKSTQWIFDFWFRREVRQVIRKLDERGIDLVLRNLLHLEKIDYQAEEILSVIAEGSPEKVLGFLCQRLEKDGEQEETRTYDAIPFEMHKLNEPLSKIPKKAVRTVRKLYDGNFGMFIFREAHLLKTIFPQFPPEFEAELLDIVNAGAEDDLEFVLAVLRNYEGQPFIHNVCKAIVRQIAPESEYRNEVAIALQTAGVVTGAFGFAEAYERKKEEIKNWLDDPDEKVREFTKWYIAGLEQMSAADRKRAEEEIALRKHRYGE